MTPQQQKQSFDDNGYLVVPDVLSPDELAALRQHVDGVLDGSIKPSSNTQPLEDFAIQWEPSVRDDPSVARRDKIRVAFHLAHTNDFFWRHATRPALLDVVSNLLGPDVTFYTDQMFVKPARHGSEVPFHQDQGYWPMVDPACMLLSCWVAIDDATIANGCVRMIPGSHKRALPHRHFPGTTQEWGLLPEDVEASREVAVELKAGSAMFHHSLTVHRSTPNHTDHARRGLVTIYMPSTLRLVRPWPFQYGFKLLRGREHTGCINENGNTP